MKQFTFDFDSKEGTNIQETRDAVVPSLSIETENFDAAYGSLKALSLVRLGSIQSRPCLTSTDESKAFFKRYWAEHPAHDQEQFVVACLDTKHRVQSVVVVTVGTLDASLVHPREVFKPAISSLASVRGLQTRP